MQVRPRSGGSTCAWGAEASRSCKIGRTDPGDGRGILDRHQGREHASGPGAVEVADYCLQLIHSGLLQKPAPGSGPRKVGPGERKLADALAGGGKDSVVHGGRKGRKSWLAPSR